MKKLTALRGAVGSFVLTLSAFVLVSCQDRVSGISLNKTFTTIDVGESEQLLAEVMPTNATNRNVTWTSSAVSVATVSTGGVVTAVGVGKATIMATTTDRSRRAECSIETKLVYVGGSSANSADVQIPGYWVAGVWTILPPQDSMRDSEVMSLAIMGSDVYAGGWTRSRLNDWVGGYWKNGVWSGLTSFDAAESSWVYSMCVSGIVAYAGGASYICLGIGTAIPGYWVNDVWTELPRINSAESGYVTSIFVSGADVYAGGVCHDESMVAVPGYWKNGFWTRLTPLDVARECQVYSLFVSGTDVYTGGYCTNSSRVQVPGYWVNGVWTELPRIDPTRNGWVSSILASGPDVYAGDCFSKVKRFFSKPLSPSCSCCLFSSW